MVMDGSKFLSFFLAFPTVATLTATITTIANPTSNVFLVLIGIASAFFLTPNNSQHVSKIGECIEDEENEA
uniref:Uncharacterized protein n=1 Tax=Lepeophtheirus salmonis TaxID=72036 RepID=A0A0K2U042_LEPSM